VRIGESELDAPEWTEAQDQAGIAYVRTYDVQLHPAPSESGSLAAIVRHVRAFGPVIRVELDLVEDGRTIEAHLPRGQFDRAPVMKGQRLYVSPTHARVFPREA
jgi:ABC-type sulfate/molybdate transport systems ATPase subunit